MSGILKWLRYGNDWEIEIRGILKWVRYWNEWGIEMRGILKWVGYWKKAIMDNRNKKIFRSKSAADTF